MKLVLDTNVWLSGIFWEGEASKIIEKAEKKNIQILISENILSEIVDVLNKESKFQKYILNLKLSLEAALDGKVDYIVSYDSHLLNMIEFRGIKIISPGEFLKI